MIRYRYEEIGHKVAKVHRTLTGKSYLYLPKSWGMESDKKYLFKFAPMSDNGHAELTYFQYPWRNATMTSVHVSLRKVDDFQPGERLMVTVYKEIVEEYDTVFEAEDTA